MTLTHTIAHHFHRGAFLLSFAAALAIVSPSANADPPANQTVTIDGDTYTVASDELLRRWGFEPVDIPRDENAAWVYIEAFDTLNDYPENQELFRQYEHVLKHGFTGEFPELRAWVRGRRDYIALIRKASRMRRYAFPWLLPSNDRGRAMPASLHYPQLTKMRMAARLLAVDAWLHTDEGEFGEAVESLATIQRLAAHVPREGQVIHGMVGIAANAIGNDAARDIVRRYEFPAKHLAELQRELTQAWQGAPAPAHIFNNERRWLKAIVDDLFSFDDGRSGAGEPDQPARKGHPHFSHALLGTEGLLVLIPERTIKSHCEAGFDETIAMCGRPAWVLKHEWDSEALYEKHVPQWDIVGRMLFPSLGRVALKSAKARIDNDLTRTLVALHRHKADTGAFPKQLADLAPKYLDAIPIDGWDPDGKPLRYRPTADPAGYVLYSVATDGKDDGGKPDALQSMDSERPGDYGFTYPAPEPEAFE